MELVPTFIALSPHAYLLVFSIGAAMIAMWLHLRIPHVGPASAGPIMLHLIVSVVAANVIVPTVLRSADSHATVVAVMVAVALPLVVYMFLSAIWLIRFGQAALGRYSR